MWCLLGSVILSLDGTISKRDGAKPALLRLPSILLQLANANSNWSVQKSNLRLDPRLAVSGNAIS